MIVILFADMVGEQRKQFRRVVNPSQVRQCSDLMMTGSTLSRLVQEHQGGSSSSGCSSAYQWYPTGSVGSVHYTAVP